MDQGQRVEVLNRVAEAKAPLVGRMDAVIGQAKGEAGHVDAQVLLEERQCGNGAPVTVVLDTAEHPVQHLQIRTTVLEDKAGRSPPPIGPLWP